MMKVSLFTQVNTGSFAFALPDAIFSFNTPAFPTVGAISLKYPTTGLNADQLFRDCEVYAVFDIGPDDRLGRTGIGTYEPFNARWVLEDPKYEWDESAGVSYLNWTGRGVVSMADRAVLQDPSGEAPGANEDPNTFWRRAFSLFFARGGVQRIQTLYSGSLMGDGNAWPRTSGVISSGGSNVFKYDAFSTDYLAGLISCVDDYHIMDLRMQADSILLYPQGYLGSDWSSLNNMFIPGVNVLEIEDQDSQFKDLRNAGVVLYSDGSVTIVHADNWNGIGGSNQRYGGYDRRETTVSSDWPTDPAYAPTSIASQVNLHYPQVKAFAVQSLTQVASITPSVSFTIDERSNFQPWRDFDVFDTVPAPRIQPMTTKNVASMWTPLQVVDISCTRDETGGTRYGIVCGEPRSNVTEKLSAYARSHFGKHTKVGKELWKTYQHW
jgi:hypothetical protein